jgi:hypothetical protein
MIDRLNRAGPGYRFQDITGIRVEDIPTEGSSTASRAMSDIDVKDAPSPSPQTTTGFDKAVLFYGKPAQLEPFLAFLSIQFIVKSTPEASKAAVSASLFRGQALTWIANKIQKDDAFISNVAWTDFKLELQETFGISDEAQSSQAARKLASLKQTSSVQAYANDFTQLASKARIPNATAVAFFIQGLKPNIKQALIIADTRDSLDGAVQEARRLDDELFYSRSNRRNVPSFPSNGRKAKGKKGSYIKKEYE